jgi:hypothetical protein
MEAGYVPDYREGRFSQQSWWPGKPTNSFWMGLKWAKDQKDQVAPVTTLRCPKCGYLESYAIPNSFLTNRWRKISYYTEAQRRRSGR